MAFKKTYLSYPPRVSKDDLMFGVAKCIQCEKPTKAFYFVSNDIDNSAYAICINCVLELNPPKWKLVLAATNHKKINFVEPVDHYELWDDTNKRIEQTLSVSELIQCGWFIRKVEESDTKVPKRIIRKIDLEYYGTLACVRFKSYYDNMGLYDINKCRSPFCEFVQDNMETCH